MSTYAQYVDSCIDWVGQIPDSWGIKPLYALFRERKSPNKGNIEGNVLSLSYGRIIRRDVETNFGLLPESFETYNIVNPCNIVLRLTDLQNDKRSLRTGLAKEKGIITSAYITLESKEDVNPEYIHYLLHAYDILKVFYGLGGGVRQSMKFEDLKRLPLLLPEKDEQNAIVEFLNNKTVQIDELISKKERMIELLKEERIAVINQAVTKGLDPDVDMKDSGIEWLGEIPKHWMLKKLKFNSSIRFSNVDKKINEGEENVRLCNYVDVYYNDFITLKLEFMNATASIDEIRKFQLNVGDVIITKDSESWDDIAIPAYVAETEENLICGYHLAQIKPNTKDLDGKFLFWMLSGDSFNTQYKIEATGVTRYGLGNYALSNSYIVLSPTDEQKEIGDYLDKKTSQIADQIIREQKSIELLKEYRTVLISEVVTGKIDVRERV